MRRLNRPFSLGLETMETRDMPAAYTNLVNGVLQVVGDNGHNSATVDPSGSQIRVRITTAGSSQVVDRTFSRVDVREIRFWGYDGHDRYVCNVNVPNTSVSGGDGNDYLEGAGAADTFYGGNGNDTLVGYGGNDRLSGEAGDDRLLGMAGDDLLNGGTGTNWMDGGSGTDIAWMSQARSGTTNCEQVHISLPGGHEQTNSWSCGPNSAWRVLQSYGGTATYGHLMETATRNSQITRWRFGTTPNNLVSVMNANRQGMTGEYRFGTESGASVERIVGLLRQGRPVIALVREGAGLHWVAVDGFDATAQRLYYTDTNGRRYMQSYSDFQSRMNWDFGWTANNTLRLAGVSRNTIVA